MELDKWQVEEGDSGEKGQHKEKALRLKGVGCGSSTVRNPCAWARSLGMPAGGEARDLSGASQCSPQSSCHVLRDKTVLSASETPFV